MQTPDAAIKCAVTYYPILATPDGKTDAAISASAKRYGFYWTDLKKIERIPAEIPLFIVSVGKESHPEVKETTDHFVRTALTLGVPMTYVHYAAGSTISTSSTTRRSRGRSSGRRWIF